MTRLSLLQHAGSMGAMTAPTFPVLRSDRYPVRIGSYLRDAQGLLNGVQVIAPPDGAYRAPDGYFLVKFDRTGLMRFARLTGKTRKSGRYYSARTVDTYEVETVVIDCAIVGVLGKRVVGGRFDIGSMGNLACTVVVTGDGGRCCDKGAKAWTGHNGDLLVECERHNRIAAGL